LAHHIVQSAEELSEKFFESVVASKLPAGRTYSEAEINGFVNSVKTDTNFTGVLSTIRTRIQQIKGRSNTDEEKLALLVEELSRVIPTPSSTVTVNRTVSGSPVTLGVRDVLEKYKTELLEALHLEQFLNSVLTNLRPEFVYLSEEMELKRRVLKGLLTKESEEFAINYRLLKVMGVNFSIFSGRDLADQNPELENRADSFSNRLQTLWRQHRIRIEVRPTENELLFIVKDVDERNRPIRTTHPEMRSRGFKWYLSYLVTLEYLKNRENVVLLMDDPAVFLHERGQKDFLNVIEDISRDVQVFYNTHLISLFDERELDRVILVERDEEGFTRIKRPWTNKIEDVAAPVYHALGFDKLIFGKVGKGILLVEGIADKFILEGLQKCCDKELAEWYIHPLFGDKLEDNEIVEKVNMLGCLFGKKLTFLFLLDGDRRKKFERLENRDIQKRIIFLGNETQEMEDLLGAFYLDCVEQCYREIFIGEPERIKAVETGSGA